MSAYMVSKAHIEALAHVALYGPEGAGSHWDGVYFGIYPQSQRTNVRNVSALCTMLATENLRSIHARYPDCIANPENTPGPCDRYWERPVQFGQFLAARIPVLTAFSLIGCYEYQSCEHDGWEASAANRFCRNLTKALIHHLPGYDAAPWGIDSWSDIKPAKPLLADAPVREAARVIAETIVDAKRKRDESNLLQMPVTQRKLF